MKADQARFSFAEKDGEEHGFWGMIDVLTLLLVFFVVMYVQALPGQSPKKPAEQAVARPAAQAEFSRVASRHLDGLLGNGFYISPSNESLTLVLEEKLSFASGQAELSEDALAILARVAELIEREKDYAVIISGHTDDLPIRNGAYRSNWHLATARAVAVAERFLALGVSPQRITTQGLAEFRPLFSGSSPDARARNRRVEITLSKKISP